MRYQCPFIALCVSFCICVLVFFSPFISIRSNEHNTENNKQRKEANTKSRENGKIPEILCPEGEIPLAVHYQMLDLDSMGDEDSGSNLVKSDEEYIASLLSWTQANKNSSCIRESSLLQFWSPGKRVGDLWILYGSQEGELSHNRHDPPAYSGIQSVIFDLLQTFHPRPFLQTRFEPRGGYAVLRAYNGDIVDIFIRFHAEFQLNEKPLLPFWFTPAYFTGNIVLNTKTGDLLQFNLHVPTTNELNVDLEWYGSNRPDDNLMVDIGYLPVMELKSTFSFSQENVYNWSDEISVEEAQKILEKAFFPFKQVDYLPFEKALLKAKEESKLIHHIVLWGSLDDQSC